MKPKETPLVPDTSLSPHICGGNSFYFDKAKVNLLRTPGVITHFLRRPHSHLLNIRMGSYTAILLMLFAVLLDGCTPNAVSYYHPAVDGGKVLKPHCVPTESIVEFNLPDVNGYLHVRAWADNGKHINQVSLFFSGNAWREIHFTSTDFRIRDVENNSIQSASSIIAYKSDSISNLTTELYYAPPARPRLFRFHVQINLTRPLPNDFELLSPAIAIDGQEIIFPVIRFEQKQWIGISPINC